MWRWLRKLAAFSCMLLLRTSGEPGNPLNYILGMHFVKTWDVTGVCARVYL